jgi:hypothetical protein
MRNGCSRHKSIIVVPFSQQQIDCAVATLTHLAMKYFIPLPSEHRFTAVPPSSVAVGEPLCHFSLPRGHSPGLKGSL